MEDLAAVKKDAQQYENECEISALIRKTVGFLSFGAAVGAAFCAFTGLDEQDRWFSAMVVVLIFWEVFGYGIDHWRGKHTEAKKYHELARQIERSSLDAPHAEQELRNLGSPDSGSVVRTLAAIANKFQWSGFYFYATIGRVVVTVILVAGAALGSAMILTKIIPHFR